MAAVLQPWQILVTALAGWITPQQDAVIEYLREENRVLREQLKQRRLRLTDCRRHRLAAKGTLLARKVPGQVATIVTPDTILAWHRRLIAKKWDFGSRRRNSGRPMVMNEITERLLSFENQHRIRRE